MKKVIRMKILKLYWKYILTGAAVIFAVIFMSKKDSETNANNVALDGLDNMQKGLENSAVENFQEADTLQSEAVDIADNMASNQINESNTTNDMNDSDFVNYMNR
jgi:Rps23 Pro-64 3,4-dihydroxylase Tpa1-like proline 4-hydroxylase